MSFLTTRDSGVLHHRWQCLLARDQEAKKYMPKPPIVAYSRTKSLRDILVRSKLPPLSKRRVRQAQIGFKNARKACSRCGAFHLVICTKSLKIWDGQTDGQAGGHK